MSNLFILFIRRLRLLEEVFLPLAAFLAVPVTCSASDVSPAPLVATVEVAQDSVLTKELKESLDLRMEEYFRALETESVKVKEEESDFMIEACRLPRIRQYVALKIYSHFMESRIMGDEAVAIYLYDKWFSSGKIPMNSEVDLLNAGVFADFNRSSLIGCMAPELILSAPDGRKMTLFPSDSSKGPSPLVSDRCRVLLFHDADCAFCKVEIPRLKSFLKDNAYPLDLYAVTVSSREGETFSMEDFPSVRAWDFSDPGVESDFQRKYGVLQTPKMFLIGPDGIILGRNLDTPSLKTLIGIQRDRENYDYGSVQSNLLLDDYFSSLGETLKVEDITDFADNLAERSLEKKDSVLMRHTLGDLLYYLSNKRGEVYRAGASEIIVKYIKGMPQLWRQADDSLKVVPLADMMYALYSLSPTGSRIADITVPSTLKTASKSIQGRFSLRKLHGRRNYVVFHTGGCGSCADQLAAVDSLRRLPAYRKTRFLLVDTDDILAGEPSLAKVLFDSFDLSSFPMILETDRRGTIKRKYLSFK